MELQLSEWTKALLTFVTVGCGVASIAILWEWWSERRRRREVMRHLQEIPDSGAGGDAFGDLFRDEIRGESPLLAPLMQRFPHIRDLQNLLDQAALDWRASTFLLMTIGSGTAFGLLGFLVTLTPIFGAATALLGSAAPYIYVQRKKNRRLSAFLEEFPEAVDLLGRSIRAGHAFSTGLQILTEESGEPVSGEFLRVFEELKFGLALEEALLALSDRVPLVEVRIFVIAVLIQRDVGGNLAEILDALSETIRERFRIERQVRVYTAQGRLTGYLLAALPLVVAFLIYLLNPDYISILVDEPIGRMLIATAFIMQIIGYFIIRRIVDIKV